MAVVRSHRWQSWTDVINKAHARFPSGTCMCVAQTIAIYFRGTILDNGVLRNFAKIRL